MEQPLSPPDSESLRRACVYLTGPTAVGKSGVALELAEQLEGEIVSVDSMQAYRGLDIGTDKPSAGDRRRARHHVIDAVELDQPFNAAAFLQQAQAAARDILQRRCRPIFCGGTGLYFQAWLFGLGNGPAPDPALRDSLEKCSRKELLDEIQSRDPETFRRIDPNNFRRLVRAVEAIRLTGRPYSELRSFWPSAETGAPAKSVPPIFALYREPADLKQRIHLRVDRMLERGLIEETRGLMARGLTRNPAALQSIGYRQAAEYLEGRRGYAETAELIKAKTRQLAKRQMTWFRRQLPVEWVFLRPDEAASAAASRILERLNDLELSADPET